MSNFKKIKTPRIRLADEVYRQIIDAIQQGIIDPEQRLVQEKLAAELDISRTPVREALMRLEQEGILEVAGRGGFTIRKIGNKEVLEIYQTRAAIEGYAAGLLTEKANQTHFSEIESIIHKAEARNMKTAADYYEANKIIHRAFVERTENLYLLDMFDQMWNRGFSFHLFTSIPQSDFEKSLGEHQQLCQIMRSGDATAAEKAMRDHIEQGLSLQLDAIE